MIFIRVIETDIFLQDKLKTKCRNTDIIMTLLGKMIKLFEKEEVLFMKNIMLGIEYYTIVDLLFAF